MRIFLFCQFKCRLLSWFFIALNRENLLNRFESDIKLDLLVRKCPKFRRRPQIQEILGEKGNASNHFLLKIIRLGLTIYVGCRNSVFIVQKYVEKWNELDQDNDGKIEKECIVEVLVENQLSDQQNQSDNNMDSTPRICPIQL